MVTSFCACKATASVVWVVPTMVPGGKPVTALPGLTPRSPVTMVGPMLVTVEPAKTAKLAATPSVGATPNIGRAQAFPTVTKSRAAMVNKVVT